MKQTKIVFMCLLSTFLQATPYFGIQKSFMNERLYLKMKGHDQSLPDEFVDVVSYSPHYQNSYGDNILGFGALAGYNQALNMQYNIFAEAQYVYCNQKKVIDHIDMIDIVVKHHLTDETVAVRKRHQYGFLAGIESKITNSLFGILGCGVTLTQYDATAHHAENDGTIHQENLRRNRAYIMAFEPTLGIRLHLDSSVSARLLVGYSLGKQKQVFDNYLRHSVMIDRGVNNQVLITPRGLKVSFALIKQFG